MFVKLSFLILLFHQLKKILFKLIELKFISLKLFLIFITNIEGICTYRIYYVIIFFYKIFNFEIFFLKFNLLTNSGDTIQILALFFYQIKFFLIILI